MGDWLKEYIEKKGGLCSKKLKFTYDFGIFGQDDTPATLGLSNGDKIQMQLITHCICHGSLPSCYYD
uniref:Rad60/SUMO-like domain-containing protein n=1 Tax=Panagrolaimus davidi TaxID=227884 RepID=A0A914PR03_9BILA